ncbi:MAG: hypothetical protein J6Z14_04070, partial [Prevotella sp.]|nr:hypothetical protein [Prevotella sp.]
MIKKSTSIKILTRRAAMTLILAILTASTAWAQAQATIGGITYDADGGYYVIDEPDDLRDLATYVNGTGKYRNNSTETTAHDCSGLKFKMTQDITFTYTTAWNDATSTENNFVAIGGYYDSNDRYFRGDFDGAGHTISGIRIYRSGTGYANVYQGIFGQTKGANIHGLRLADARITGYDYTGGIVGYNDGTVTDCHVANNVCIHAAQTEALYHGGIVGYNNGTVESCTSTATLTIASSATGCEDYGAIVGYNNFGTLRDNLAIGATVPAADSNTHGAIVGYNTSNGTLQRNYYTACTVAGVANATDKGCQNADVTANDGAVSAHVVILPDGVTATATTGIAYDGNFYTTSGTTITLSNTAPAPAGYQYDGYTASAGTLSGSTLTMPAADVTISVVLAAIPWAGDGSSSSPYIIEYPSQLDLLAHRVNGTHGQTLQSDGYSGKYFRLANDIAYTATTAWNDANSTEDNYEAIGYYYDGTNYRYFSGNFDGAGHTISGIRIHHSGSTNADRYQGVFGRTGSGANIHHLRLDDARITGYARTSGIVGYNYGGSTVTDCHVASDVCIHAVQSNADYHGGIVGYNEGTVANSTSAATLTIASGVTGCQYYGAIAGYNTSGTLRDNLAIGATVPAARDNYHGAIAGRNNNSGTLQRNYYTACTVAGVANATDKGCQNADVNGARHAVSIVAAEGVTIVPTGTATTYAVSGITTYEGNNGISYGGQFYAGATEQVELTLTNTATDAPAGYQYGYTASAGTLDGSTLTMPDEDVTISLALAAIDWATVNAGNSTDPYMIYNKDQLDLLAHRVNGTHGETADEDGYSGKYFRLGADITYTYTKAWNEATTEDDNNYEAIGYYDGGEIVRSFRGDFDGAGHTISGIRIYRSGNDDADKYQGIFGLTDGANIHGLRLADARITGYDNTGGIVGNNYHGTVTDCHVASNVCIHAAQSNAWYHGGIAGDNAGTVENSTSAATLTIPTGATGCECYGAIAGNNSSTGTLRDNLAIGATVPATGNSYYGAIAGRNNNGGTLQRNYYTACNVAGVANATNVGCSNADVTDNDGAVPGYFITLGENLSIASGATTFVIPAHGETAAVTYHVAAEGAQVTLSTGCEGYQMHNVTYNDGTADHTVSPDGDGKYIFTMPAANVSVTANVGVILWAGTGDKDDPYIIEFASQLSLLAYRVNGTHGETAVANGYSGKYFRLGADITYNHDTDWDDASSEENNYEAIGGYYGSTDRYFRGDFDGAGHTISGIRIHRSGTGYANSDQGIFGQTGGANIHGLRLADARITGYDDTGGIVGFNDGTVTDCHVASNVCIHTVQSEACYHGGIAGYNYGGTVANCTSAATLTIASSATSCGDYGAIAGYNYATLSDNLAIGTTVPATGNNSYGAIVGRNYGTLQRNYYTACKVASENVTPSDVGCANADVAEMTKSNVTYYDGAVPALRDQADNTQAIALLAALA